MCMWVNHKDKYQGRLIFKETFCLMLIMLKVFQATMHSKLKFCNWILKVPPHPKKSRGWFYLFDNFCLNWKNAHCNLQFKLWLYIFWWKAMQSMHDITSLRSVSFADINLDRSNLSSTQVYRQTGFSLPPSCLGFSGYSEHIFRHPGQTCVQYTRWPCYLPTDLWSPV